MYRLVSYLSCCLVLVAGTYIPSDYYEDDFRCLGPPVPGFAFQQKDNQKESNERKARSIDVEFSTAVPEQSVYTTNGEDEDFPVVTDTLPTLDQPSPQEQALMDEQKINWLPVWQEHDLRESKERQARSVDAVSSTAVPLQVVDSSTAAPEQSSSTTARVASTIVIEESISPVRETKDTVSSTTSSTVIHSSTAAPEQSSSTTARVSSTIVIEESISPVRETKDTVSSTTSSTVIQSSTAVPEQSFHITSPVPHAPVRETEKVVVETVYSNPRDGNSQVCPSTSDRGLTQLIRTARPLLPADQLRNILANAVQSDVQVKNLVQLLRSDKFKQQAELLRATKEFKTLQDYLCQRLKLNYDYYKDYVKVFLNVHINDQPSSLLPNRRTGILGLLQDLRSALPRKELRDLYQRLYSSDRELSQSVRLIRGREFRIVLRKVRLTKEYIAVQDELRKANVPISQVSSLVATALGWSNIDIGEELVLVNL